MVVTGGCVLPELLPLGILPVVLQGAGIQVWRSSGRGSADPRVEGAAWFLPASMFELLIGCSPLDRGEHYGGEFGVAGRVRAALLPKTDDRRGADGVVTSSAERRRTAFSGAG